MLRAEPALPLRHALALGLAQGPAELLPVSSSAHTTLIGLLAGWPHSELDPRLRKSLDIALHAGAGLALAIDMRSELAGELAAITPRRAAVAALSLAPPALAGLTLRAAIERRLGGPRSIAAGLVAGALAMACADARPGRGRRRREDARPADGLALGVAQALALIPGVSRSGATLTAARARGFTRRDAQSLSWHAALPVLLGAGSLELARLARLDRRGPGRPPLAALAGGGASAFASTLLSARLLRRPRWAERPLAPYALYRCGLAALVMLHTRGADHGNAIHIKDGKSDP